MSGHLVAIGSIITIVVAGLLKSFWNGKLREVLEERQQGEVDARSAHELINDGFQDLQESIDRIEGEVEENTERMENLSYEVDAVYDEVGEARKDVQRTQKAIVVLHENGKNEDLREFFDLEDVQPQDLSEDDDGTA